jgi:hypothetical protein
MITITLDDNNPKLIKALKSIIECFDVNYKITNPSSEKMEYTKQEFEKKLEKSKKSGIAYEFSNEADFLSYVNEL